jgi:hypothetical protein
LKKYKYIVWADASIVIANPNFVVDIVNIVQESKSEMFIFEHYKRTNIHDECNSSTILAKYDNQKLTEQVFSYYKAGYEDTKLCECGFFIYKQGERMSRVLDDWWNEILTHSYQDQISFPYVLWKNGVVPRFLNEPHFIKGSLEGSVWNNRLCGFVREHITKTK